jgi:hypothetical protein
LINDDNVGKFYKYVNKKLGSPKSNHPVTDPVSNVLITDDTEIANVFNKYFGSVFTADDGLMPDIANRSDNDTFIDSVDFSVEAVRSCLSRVKPSTSYGPDGVPNILLKKLANCICMPLSYIFDASFKSNCLPQQWCKHLSLQSLKKVLHLTLITIDQFLLHVRVVVLWRGLLTLGLSITYLSISLLQSTSTVFFENIPRALTFWKQSMIGVWHWIDI